MANPFLRRQALSHLTAGLHDMVDERINAKLREPAPEISAAYFGASPMPGDGEGEDTDLLELAHTELRDMPGADNADHDGRYPTEAEVAAVGTPSGADLVGVRDTAAYFASHVLETILAAIGAALGSLTNYWQRGYETLLPATADDNLVVSTSTQLAAITGINSSPYTRGAQGVYGVHTGEADGFGVSGDTTSSDNAAYGGFFDRERLENYEDAKEQAGDPATPPATFARRFAKAAPVAGSRESLKSDTGVVHDLTPQLKQIFAAGGQKNNTAGCALFWAYGKHPSGTIITPAVVVATQYCSFTAPAAEGNAVLLTDGYCQFAWAPTGNPTWQQSYFAVAVPVRLQPGDGGTTACKTARVAARIRVSATADIAAIRLTLEDSAGSAASNTTICSPGGTAWAEYISTDIDITGWTGPLRISVAVYGTVGSTAATTVDIEYLSLELWAE